MIIDTQGLAPLGAYKLLTGAVVPRPIAWISTVNEDGGVNLAPFSAYTYVSSDPAMLGINMAKRNGERKDTIVNVLRNKNFVVNVVDQSLIDEMHQSALEYPRGVSEATVLQLDCVASAKVSTPRLARARVAMECTLDQIIEFGNRTEFVIGIVQAFYVKDELFDDNKIDAAGLDPVARLAGPRYAQLGEILTLPVLTELAKIKL